MLLLESHEIVTQRRINLTVDRAIKIWQELGTAIVQQAESITQAILPIIKLEKSLRKMKQRPATRKGRE